MKSEDESIKLLKNRMHQQMNISTEQEIKLENIQYYASSLMMQKESIQQKESMQQKEDAQQDGSADEEEMEDAEEKIEEYGELPVDSEYIKEYGEIPPAMKDIKVPETMEVQHERAKNGYEKVLHSEEELFGYKRMHWINIKG